MLRRAIGECVACNEIPNFGVVVEHLPNDFALELDELRDMIADMYPAASAPSQPEPAQVSRTDDSTGQPEDEITYEVDPALLTTAEGIERVKHGIAESEARRQLDEANARLNAARERLVNARVNLRRKRDDLASAAYAWQALADSATDGVPADLRRQIEVRNHLAATAKEREARKARNNSATAFVQKNMQNGPSRGAYSRSAAARTGFQNFDPRRGATAKLPSDR